MEDQPFKVLGLSLNERWRHPRLRKLGKIFRTAAFDNLASMIARGAMKNDKNFRNYRNNFLTDKRLKFS